MIDYIISSFPSHAILLSFGVAQEHSTLGVSNLDGAHWALTEPQPGLLLAELLLSSGWFVVLVREARWELSARPSELLPVES